eukprot:3720641-Pyramimonas_sp.AAC.1
MPASTCMKCCRTPFDRHERRRQPVHAHDQLEDAAIEASAAQGSEQERDRERREGVPEAEEHHERHGVGGVLGEANDAGARVEHGDVVQEVAPGKQFSLGCRRRSLDAVLELG